MRHGWLAMSARSLCWPRPLREGAGGCRRRRTAGPSVARRQDTTWRLSETGTKTPVTRTFWLWPAPSNGWSSRGTRISGRWRSGIGRLIVASFGWWSCRRHENRPEDSAHTRTGVAPRSTGHGGSASASRPKGLEGADSADRLPALDSVGILGQRWPSVPGRGHQIMVSFHHRAAAFPPEQQGSF